MSTPDVVGRTYPKTPVYEVGREKIREFATAIGDTNPAYHDVEAARKLGHRDLVAPPTFAIIVTVPASVTAALDPDVNLDYSRVVHGDQRFEYRRPIYAGDRLVCQATIDSLRERAGSVFVSTRTDIFTEDGEQVGSAYATIVSRAPQKES